MCIIYYNYRHQIGVNNLAGDMSAPPPPAPPPLHSGNYYCVNDKHMAFDV